MISLGLVALNYLVVILFDFFGEKIPIFGVYLIHDDNLVRPFLWETLFKDASYANSNLLILYSIAVIILVFIVCTLIELFRIYVIEKHYMKSGNDLADKIENRINKFYG